ncbi:HAD-IA family hydrolase [Nonomuraea sp. NPDC050540]|uniref:HAD-IA family hydrolase n=1 Tax=Nonomuraea sp. NPDC050540 TaxID=3364367 RepID=UPI0037ADE87F
MSPVRPDAAVLIRRLAVHLPPVLAGLAHLFAAVLGKPHPEGYITAMERRAEIVPRLRPEDIVVFEDSAPGISAAGAAGMRTVSVHPAAGKHADLMRTAMGEMELAREGPTIGWPEAERRAHVSPEPGNGRQGARSAARGAFTPARRRPARPRHRPLRQQRRPRATPTCSAGRRRSRATSAPRHGASCCPPATPARRPGAWPRCRTRSAPAWPRGRRMG